MKIMGWLIGAGLVLLAVFAAANWGLLAEPASLNFLAFAVQGPLGLILLGVTLAFVSLFLIYVLSVRTAALTETRRHLKELGAQRELADKAEASRFTALGAQLEQEFTRLRAAIDESRAEARLRTDALEQSQRSVITDNANALFANIGEIDDKLERIAAKAGAGRPS